jgi:uncharacterized protein YndB with AHSA1/START domain
MSRPEADGVIRKLAGGYEIVFVRRLARPIDKVWAALTQPERIADWLGVVTPERSAGLGVGAQFELRFPQNGYRTMCEVVAMDAPRLFAWTWGLPEGSARLEDAVRFELAPDGDGCILTLTNGGLARQDLESVAAGWHTHLEGLEGAADGVRSPWSSEREKPHLDRYAATLEGLRK